MLHIILFILTIIGWILLAILGIIVLLACVAVFSPLRYRGNASCKGTQDSVYGRFNFSWLAHLVSGYALYEDGKLRWSFRIAWKKLSGEEEVSLPLDKILPRDEGSPGGDKPGGGEPGGGEPDGKETSPREGMSSEEEFPSEERAPSGEESPSEEAPPPGEGFLSDVGSPPKEAFPLDEEAPLEECFPYRLERFRAWVDIPKKTGDNEVAHDLEDILMEEFLKDSLDIDSQTENELTDDQQIEQLMKEEQSARAREKKIIAEMIAKGIGKSPEEVYKRIEDATGGTFQGIEQAIGELAKGLERSRGEAAGGTDQSTEGLTKEEAQSIREEARGTDQSIGESAKAIGHLPEGAAKGAGQSDGTERGDGQSDESMEEQLEKSLEEADERLGKSDAAKNGMEQSEAVADEKDGQPENKKIKLFRKLKEKFTKIYTKMIALSKKLKYTFRKICGNIKTLLKKKEKLEAFITDEVHKSALFAVLAELKRLLRLLKPKKFYADIHFGFRDPARTGNVLAAISMVYPFIGAHADIQPDFEQRILEGQLIIAGKVRMLYAVSILWNLIWNKNVRTTLRHVRKFKL